MFSSGWPSVAPQTLQSPIGNDATPLLVPRFLLLDNSAHGNILGSFNLSHHFKNSISKFPLKVHIFISHSQCEGKMQISVFCLTSYKNVSFKPTPRTNQILLKSRRFPVFSNLECLYRVVNRRICYPSLCEIQTYPREWRRKLLNHVGLSKALS